MNILVTMAASETRDQFLTKENIEYLESLGTVYWNETGKPYDEEGLREAIKDMDAVITGWGTPSSFTAHVMENANRLKIIAHTAGSVNGLVTDAVYEKGVHVVCGNDAFAHSVAEGTMAYILAAQRRIPEFNDDMHRKGWGPLPYENWSLSYKKVGIVGLGAVSNHLIGMLQAFRTSIMVFSNHLTEEEAAKRGVQKASLDEIFSQCDIVSLHCAKSEKNHHLVNAALLSKLKDGALVVNTSRGDVLDEDALYEECRTGRLRAALDVYDAEADLPLQSRFRYLEGALMMPHHAGPTIDRRQTAALIAIEDIANFFAGKPLQQEITQSRCAMMTK